MYKLIIISDFCLTIIISWFLFKFYFKFYGRFMLNLNLEWDKLIEKPRLLFLSFFLLIYVIILYSKYNMKDNDYFDLIFYFVSILSILISILIFLCFNNKVLKGLIFNRHQKSLKESSKNLNFTNEQIQYSYNQLNQKKIISCSLESFISLLKLAPLKNDKIKWLFIGQKTNNKKNKSNLNSLVEFIVATFKMNPNDSSLNKSIENIISTYFTDNHGIDFNISNNTVSKWRNREPKDYLIELKHEINQIFNGSTQ